MNRRSAQTITSVAQIPAELLRSTPRHCELTVKGKFAVAAAVAMVIGAIAFSVAGYLSAKHASALQREMSEHGNVVLATVVKTYRTGGDDKRDVFVYEFNIDDRTYSGKTEVESHRSPGYAAGSQVSVRYLPSRPETNWIDGYPHEGIPLFVIPIVSGAMLACAFAMFWNLRRQEELVAEGRAALAVVTSVKRTRRGHNRRQRAQIEFDLLSGSRQEAYVEFGRTSPPPNSTIVVVYDRDNPKRLLRYPACLVRVERPDAW